MDEIDNVDIGAVDNNQVVDSNVESQVEVNAADEQSKVEDSNEVSPTEKKSEYEMPKGIKKRFDAMTRDKYALQAKVEELTQIVKASSQKPVNEDDLTDSQLIDYKVQQHLAKISEEQRKAELMQHQNELRQQAQNEQINSFKSFAPDLEEVLQDNADLILPGPALKAIKTSDISMLLAYTIAKDESIQAKINALSMQDPSGQTLDRYMMKLELKLENDVENRSKPTASTTKVNAPTGTKAPTKSSKPFDPLTASMSEYRKWKAGQR